MHKVNLAIQVLPFEAAGDKISIIDQAIQVIQESGLQYVVCPFETVVEGTYDEVMDVVKKIKDTCLASGTIDLIINLKLHLRKDADAFITNKTKKYQ